MSLDEEFKKVYEGFKIDAPEAVEMFDADTKVMIEKGIGSDAPQIGDRIPDFSLPDQLGENKTLSELLQQGPLVISFYRGIWCPYCGIELNALQKTLPKIKGLGASLIAISPQLPDESIDTVEKNNLTFSVLSDVGNKVARSFGLVFQLSEHLRPIYSKFGIDLPKYNGDDTFELPVPGTFIIGQDSLVKAAFVNADYKQRMSPEDVLEVLASICIK